MNNHASVTQHFDVAAAATSAGTDVEGAAVDTQGWEGVEFAVEIATANAANFLKIQQSADGSTGWADLAGTAAVAGADGDTVRSDIYRPEKRYVRAVIDRGGANTATTTLRATLYGPTKAPTHSTVEVVTYTATPAEGTP